MADREPPPLFGDDNDAMSDSSQNDDLFASAVEQPKAESELAESVPAPDVEDDEDSDLFADSRTSEVPLDSPEDKLNDSPAPAVINNNAAKDTNGEPPKVGVTDITSTAATIPSKPAPTTHNTAASAVSSSQPAPFSLTSATNNTKQLDDDEAEEEASGDRFNMDITVTDPRKVGDGMNAYIVYKVQTKTSIPQFKSSEMSVSRRFSDFLGLHEKLVETHQHKGRIVPPAPEKSVLGMTKIKMSKEESGSTEFVEKRRAALERFLVRTAHHPVLQLDEDFREFLERDGDLPRSTSTSALSGAGVMRLFNKVGDSLGKMTFKMDESDQWFEEKQQTIDQLDTQLRKLHASIESLVTHRKELASNTGSFSKSIALLGNSEEHTALSRALAQLAELEEKVDTLHMDQADSDFFVLAELIKDYVQLIGAVKDVFHERVKIFKNWKDAEANLSKKRELKSKLELQRKLDKIPVVQHEIIECERKVEQGQQDFEAVSKQIRKEVAAFERRRIKDFKLTIVNYLETLMKNQIQLIKLWESFIPEAKAIA